MHTPAHDTTLVQLFSVSSLALSLSLFSSSSLFCFYIARPFPPLSYTTRISLLLLVITHYHYIHIRHEIASCILRASRGYNITRAPLCRTIAPDQCSFGDNRRSYLQCFQKNKIIKIRRFSLRPNMRLVYLKLIEYTYN